MTANVRRSGPGDPVVLGPYEVLDALGEAGLAAVYRGRAPDGGLVAVKVLRAELASDADARRWFRESVTAARLVPAAGTAPILDADLTSERPYAVLELVGGRTLLDHVRASGPLPGDVLHDLAVRTAAVLAATHRAGVLHRNLKPKTVLLTEDRGPLVIGYGYARLAADARPGYEDRLGTPPYYVPELLRGDLDRPSADVFGWGVTLAYAGTGREPFGTGSIATVIDRILHRAPDLAGLPSRLASLVARCLEKDPADRPAFDRISAELAEAGAGTDDADPAWGPRWHAVTRADAGFALDGYEIHERLGQGGAAVVHRARRVALDREVAVKVLHHRLAEGGDRRRFQREVDAAVRLSEHPGVVTLFDAGTLRDGRPYLVMELCPGGSLADRLERERSLPAAEVAGIGVQVADALAAAHGLGVLHRDIKPGNLLVTRFGRVALADFGIAALPGPGWAATTSMTPSYAAPQVLEGAAPQPADDVYSLGATLYTLLAGHPPHAPEGLLDGPALHAHLYAARRERVPDITGIPEALQAVLRRSLDADLGIRFGSAAGLRDALAAVPI